MDPHFTDIAGCLRKCITDADALDDLATCLEKLLGSGCTVWTDEQTGKDILLFTRAEVARFNGLKILIYPNDHPPPHFHVRNNAGPIGRFAIADCSLISGAVDSTTRDLIKFFHSEAKDKLTAFWDATRPTG